MNHIIKIELSNEETQLLINALEILIPDNQDAREQQDRLYRRLLAAKCLNELSQKADKATNLV